MTRPRTSDLSIDHEWCASSADARLEDTGVHVWMARLERLDFLDDARVLSAHEERRARQFVIDRDRLRFVRSHSVLRLLLSRYLHVPAKTVRMRNGRHGKPAVAAPLHFNMSHSAGVAVYGFSRGAPLGVDVERIRLTVAFERIARRICSPAETRLLDAQAVDRRPGEFFTLWTRKEAVMKAIGCGFAMNPSQIDVAGRGRHRAWRLAHVSEPPSTWHVIDLPASVDYRAALAVERRPHHVRCWVVDAACLRESAGAAEEVL